MRHSTCVVVVSVVIGATAVAAAGQGSSGQRLLLLSPPVKLLIEQLLEGAVVLELIAHVDSIRAIISFPLNGSQLISNICIMIFIFSESEK